MMERCPAPCCEKIQTESSGLGIDTQGIFERYDRRIVSYVISNSNNNALVFNAFDKAIARNPNAHPLCHSDRGYQYTSREILVKTIEGYIEYYNCKRLQRNLGVLTPFEKHEQYMLVA